MRPMFKEFIARGLDPLLLYSVRHEEEAAFYQELLARASSHHHHHQQQQQQHATGLAPSTEGSIPRVVLITTGGGPAAATGVSAAAAGAAAVVATAPSATAIASAPATADKVAVPNVALRPQGRMNVAMLRDVVQGSGKHWEVYICGPEGFMEVVGGMLAEVGVPGGQIHTESFAF